MRGLEEQLHIWRCSHEECPFIHDYPAEDFSQSGIQKDKDKKIKINAWSKTNKSQPDNRTQQRSRFPKSLIPKSRIFSVLSDKSTLNLWSFRATRVQRHLRSSRGTGASARPTPRGTRVLSQSNWFCHISSLSSSPWKRRGIPRCSVWFLLWIWGGDAAGTFIKPPKSLSCDNLLISCAVIFIINYLHLIGFWKQFINTIIIIKPPIRSNK